MTVEGYRGFTVIGHELHSFSGGPNMLDYTFAPGRANRARCDQVGKVKKTKVWINNTEGKGLIQVFESQGHGRIPDPNCGCGFWFYRSEMLARLKGPGGPLFAAPFSPYGNFGGMKDPDGWIMGRVEGGGHTVPGTDGYRTEFVAITGLIPGIPGTDDELTAILAKRMKAVAAHYHVPILEPTRYMKGWIISVEISGETALVALGHPGREAMTFALPVEEASMLPPMPPAPLVTIGYQTRGSMRWITEVLVDEGDDES